MNAVALVSGTLRLREQGLSHGGQTGRGAGGDGRFRGDGKSGVAKGARLHRGCNDSVTQRSVTADLMARAREIVLMMGRRTIAPCALRCGERPTVRREHGGARLRDARPDLRKERYLEQPGGRRLPGGVRRSDCADADGQQAGGWGGGLDPRPADYATSARASYALAAQIPRSHCLDAPDCTVCVGGRFHEPSTPTWRSPESVTERYGRQSSICEEYGRRAT